MYITATAGHTVITKINMRELMIYAIIGVGPSLARDLNNFLRKCRTSSRRRVVRRAANYYYCRVCMRYNLVNKSQAGGLTRRATPLNNHTPACHRGRCAYARVYIARSISGRRVAEHVSPIIRYTYKFHASSHRRRSGYRSFRKSMTIHSAR